MKIYTKQGDTGKTQVYAQEVLKLDKDDALLECYGTLDELNAQIGVVRALFAEHQQLTALSGYCVQLQDIQQGLFSIGFAISNNEALKIKMVEALETSIDQMQSELPPQTKFILPGGHLVAAQLHVARTIARRAERRCVSLSKLYEVNPIVLTYVNRLSDFLFVLARYCNNAFKHPDIEI